MEYDAQNGNTLILSHLDGDIARLVRVRQALEHSKVPYEIMCFPWQCPFLHGYIGPRAQLREISMTDLEAALGSDLRQMRSDWKGGLPCSRSIFAQ